MPHGDSGAAPDTAGRDATAGHRPKNSWIVWSTRGGIGTGRR